MKIIFKTFALLFLVAGWISFMLWVGTKNSDYVYWAIVLFLSSINMKVDWI